MSLKTSYLGRILQLLRVKKKRSPVLGAYRYNNSKPNLVQTFKYICQWGIPRSYLSPAQKPNGQYKEFRYRSPLPILGYLFGSIMFSIAIVKADCEKKDRKKGHKSGKKERGVTESELNKHLSDLDFIYELTTATVVCSDCSKRVPIDKKVPSIKYCHCPEANKKRKIEGYEWKPFLETEELLIWRQPHPKHLGLFIYKVYGRYDDITPRDFLQTQLDLKYRKKWDNTVVKLEIVESDKANNLDFVHWEMSWPKLFSNRDYSFARRYLIKEEEGAIVIISKSMEHPKAPEVSGVVRVKEYWSHMHIKAITTLDEPGVEFGLTYFDNPGVSLPTWLQNWVAMTAMPDFLNKVRNAARAKKAGK